MSDTDVAGLLRSYRRATHRSARDVSLAAGLSESVAGKVEAGSMEPSLRVFARLVCELGLNDREIALLVRLSARRARSAPSPSASEACLRDP